jgi:hypothetical protein
METNENIAPPLDLDLNSVDTSMPLINNGEIVEFELVKIEKKPTKDGKANYLAIDHKSTTPTKGIKGEDLQPGVHVFNNIMLAPTGKGTWDMVTKNIAAITQAAGVPQKLGEFLDGGYSALQGARVKAKIAFIAEGPDKTGVVRRAKNEVSVYIKA